MTNKQVFVWVISMLSLVPLAQQLYYSVFRRSIPQNSEEYVVTVPRSTASIEREKKEEEFSAQPMKSFHHGAVTTYSSKF